MNTQNELNAVRTIYDAIPPMIEIPLELRSRRVEVLFLALEENDACASATKADWSEGLFERTAGAWRGAPLQRAHQDDYEQRLEFE